MSNQRPTIGRIVLVPVNPAQNNGSDVAAAVVTRVWSDDVVNVRVIGDNDDSPEWRTSVTRVETLEGMAHVWAWPDRK